jgi:hypothetical protein
MDWKEKSERIVRTSRKRPHQHGFGRERDDRSMEYLDREGRYRGCFGNHLKAFDCKAKNCGFEN